MDHFKATMLFSGLTTTTTTTFFDASNNNSDYRWRRQQCLPTLGAVNYMSSTPVDTSEIGITTPI
ncbi:unnamed protein product, partial [Ceratitis capitata]